MSWVENAIGGGPIDRSGEYALSILGAIIFFHSRCFLRGRQYDSTRILTEVGAVAASLIGLFTYAAFNLCGGNRMATAILFRGFSECFFFGIVHMVDIIMFYFRYKATQKITPTEKSFFSFLCISGIFSSIGGNIWAPFYDPYDPSAFASLLLFLGVVSQAIWILYCSLRTTFFIFAITNAKRFSRVVPISLESALNLPPEAPPNDSASASAGQVGTRSSQVSGDTIELSERPWVKKLILIAYKNIVHSTVVVLTLLAEFFFGNPYFSTAAILMAKLLSMHLLFNCKYVDYCYFAAKGGAGANTVPAPLNRMQREYYVLWWAMKEKERMQNMIMYALSRSNVSVTVEPMAPVVLGQPAAASSLAK